MKGMILIFVLLSGISSAIAQEKLWLDKNYQWTDDSIQAVRYALVSKINKKCIKVEEYALEGRKKDVWHFSEYKSNPRKRIREGLHTSFYANGKDSLTEVYRDNRLEGQTMVYYPDGAIHLARATVMGNLTEHSCNTIPMGNFVERNTIQRISAPMERCSTSTELKWNISRISCFHPSPEE